MDGSLKEISDAIRGLYSNPIKDYVFPSISALFSALLGAWAASYAVKTQERNRIHINNIDTINDVTLLASYARNTLMAIKSNYHGSLSSDPIKRLFLIPRILIDEPYVTFKISSLVFLPPSKVSEIYSNWQRIEYIDTLFKNYNQVIHIWKKRNELLNEMMPKLNENNGENITEHYLMETFGIPKICEASDLTERAIMLTDELLVELSCFLIGFPEVAKRTIHNKMATKLRRIIMVLLPTNEFAVELLSKSPELDYSKAATLHSSSEKEMRHRYRSIYFDTSPIF